MYIDTYILLSQAREVIGSTLGQDALTSKRVTVTVTILDVNDNSPKFSKAQYESSMYEDVGVGHPLITMTVTDQDTVRSYCLFLYIYILTITENKKHLSKDFCLYAASCVGNKNVSFARHYFQGITLFLVLREG